jgi:predicted alpha/beta superfamily hydrolase
MVIKWQVELPELAGERLRSAYVYLPESYGWADGRRYPVLYMFDGHNVFFDQDATYGKSWGMKEYLDKSQTQLIVAAVECSHSPDNGRLSEYSPYDFADPQLGRFRGLGRETIEWLISDFKSEIDRQYRTLPDREHTFLAGSSMGGLMSLYGVLEFNHVFSRAGALSPSVWVAPGKLSKLAREARLGKDTVIYTDYGSEEGRQRPKVAGQLSKLANILESREVMMTRRIVPGGTHCEACWERQLPFLIPALMYGLE